MSENGVILIRGWLSDRACGAGHYIENRSFPGLFWENSRIVSGRCSSKITDNR
jgi:hypothetical protein